MLPLAVAGVVALLLLGLVAFAVSTFRRRLGTDAPVTEAQARAHAAPLTRSILSVGPRPPHHDLDP
jgi:hypothetical protein